MPSRSRTKMETGGSNNRVLALLLKGCNLLEMTCKLGTSATQSLVGCLKESQRRAGNPVQKCVKASMLRYSTSTSRLAQSVSDEVISLIRLPRMGVELYEVRWLHPQFTQSCTPN